MSGFWSRIQEKLELGGEIPDPQGRVFFKRGREQGLEKKRLGAWVIGWIIIPEIHNEPLNI